jgi:anti-anti-sigma factor
VNPQLGQVSMSRVDGTLVFHLIGEFDLSNSWKLNDALLAAVEAERDEIVVDLTSVRFMDAQLLRALLRARNAADTRSLKIRVIPPSDPEVWRVARLVDFPLAA